MQNARLFFLLGLNAIAFSAYSQGFYTGAGGGYGFGAAKASSTNYKSVDNGGGDATNTYSATHYSYGQGINVGLYAGYMIKKGLGVELGFTYLKSATFESKSEIENNLFDYKTKNISYHYGSTMRLLPAMRLGFGEKKLSGYVKAGPVIAVGTKRINENENSSSVFGISQTDYINTEYSGGLGIGAHGALGLTYMFTSSIGAFCEIGAVYQQWAPKKSVITRYEIDGVNELNSLTTNERETEFVDEYQQNGNPETASEPSKATRIFFPFSSAGINIGIHFSFGKTE
ncbi:MAG TPA: outer membrane beta-barrel protein [Flavobacteriales bacterium]|nr:outer membrane beta-barrel protein [Flavobacteriales bacterium]